jgi:formylglycine-generating enzyme required for sulfatase activity
MLRSFALILALLLAAPALAQTADDAAANRLFVEAVKARDEAFGARPTDDDVPGWTRQRDLLVQVERTLREIVDRHPGSTLAVRLILQEDIGGQISLQRAAREAAAAREGLETGQEIVAARRALAAVEPALSRARALSELSERRDELDRLRPQLADIATRFRRAPPAASSLATLDGEIGQLAEAIKVAEVHRALEELAPRLATARERAEPQARLADLQRLRPEVARIARIYARVPQALSSLRTLDAEMEELAAKVAAEIKVAAAQALLAEIAAKNEAAGVGRLLRDCPDCPELVVVPAGQAHLGEKWTRSFIEVTIKVPFAVGKFEVTFAEMDACFDEGGCSQRPDDDTIFRWGRGRQPAINVSWADAQEYVAWLSRKTGKSYRLLSEAEWEYAAQAGTGREAVAEKGADQVNCRGCESRGKPRSEPKPVGSFAANAFGLHDMLGNVSEWTADCWNMALSNEQADGRARTTGYDCGGRVVRGGAWINDPSYARSSHRSLDRADRRYVDLGFRVARSL